jgi:hypothetical protein
VVFIGQECVYLTGSVRYAIRRSTVCVSYIAGLSIRTQPSLPDMPYTIFIRACHMYMRGGEGTRELPCKLCQPPTRSTIQNTRGLLSDVIVGLLSGGAHVHLDELDAGEPLPENATQSLSGLCLCKGKAKIGPDLSTVYCSPPTQNIRVIIVGG